MSVLINEKGVFTKKITISRHGSSYSENTLSSVFIKHTDKYSLKATNFVTNVVPPLWHGERTLFRIREKSGIGQPIIPYWVAYPFTEYANCTLSNIFSIPQLISEVSEFFTRFNLLAQADETGVNYGLTPLNEKDIINYYETEVDAQGDPRFFLQDYCTFGVDTSGKVILRLAKKFLTEFYIIVDAEFATLLGLSEYVWAATRPNGDMITHNDDVTLFTAPPSTFIFNEQVGDGTDADNATFLRFVSGRSIYNLDRRLSVDVDVTIPHANIVSSLFGEETHEHTLLRFAIADYIRTNGSNHVTGNLIKSSIDFDDELQIGNTDLVRKTENIQAITLLPGHIQAINTYVFVRYIEGGVVQRYPLSVDSTGFWRLVLAFNKKTT